MGHNCDMDKQILLAQYEKYRSMGLHIDMTRGKPSPEQVALSLPIMDVLKSDSNFIDEDGIDCCNYGCLIGLHKCKELFSQILRVPSENIIIFGNSSLNIMYECISDAFLYGVCGSKPWSKLNKIKWLCPVPGYDRHFAICEHLGIEMINIPMNDDGPDMDLVEKYVKDPDVKGIWCVPMYSNPTGITYSEKVVERFAKLKPASKDFRIYWDNAYPIHHLYDKKDYLPDILSMAKKYDNEDIVYIFTSTSKISFPGGGVAAFAASQKNLDFVKKHLAIKTIGFDKINQFRHAKYFNDISVLEKHMKEHANILRKKFELVENIFKKELNGLAKWTKPNGGYFVSLFVPGHAKEVIEACKDFGVILTEGGCAYPYHNDPDDAHIRIAPSFVEMHELKTALDIICICTKVTLSK